MLHVNEDTNDELFRKAAEDYFLKEDNPDWERLINKIDTINPSSIQEAVIPKKKRPSRFLFLLNSSKKSIYIFL